MASTVSGTTDFSLDVDEIIEQAFEPLGGEHISAGEAKKARRALNLILIKLENRGIPINKIDFITQTLTEGTRDYQIGQDVLDVLEVNLNQDNVETPLTRYSLREYHQIPTKSQSSRVSVYTVQRLNNQTEVKVWPSPTNSVDTLEIMVYKKLQDVNASYQKIDLSITYLPLIVEWLTYELALTRQGIDPMLRQELKGRFEQTLQNALDEDRERTDFIITPGGISGW